MTALEELEQRYLAAGEERAPIHRADSDLVPYIDGAAYFRAVQDAIEATRAGDFIYILSWWLDPRCRLVPRGEELGRQLADKALAGVDVRVVLWVNPYLPRPDLWNDGTLIGSAVGSMTRHSVVQQNIDAAKLLRGLRPKRSAPPPLANRVLLDWSGGWISSHHQKAVVCSGDDAVAAFLAGMDFAPIRRDRFHHPRRRCVLFNRSHDCNWHDVGVRLTGAAGARVFETFATRWRECASLPARTYLVKGRKEVYNPPPPYPPLAERPSRPLDVPGRSAQVLRSFGPTKVPSWSGDESWATLPAEGVREIQATLCTAIDGARCYIYVEDQFLNREERVTAGLFPPAPLFSHAILFPRIAQALNRGVKVIFLTSGRADPFDGEVGRVNTTLSATIKHSILDHVDPACRRHFVLYRVDHVTIHSKVVLIDDAFLLIGSANFFDRSMEGTDSELSVAAVDTGTLVRDLRVRLWSDHLRIAPEDSRVRAELGDLRKGLALWRPGEWGAPPRIPAPRHPALRLVGHG